MKMSDDTEAASPATTGSDDDSTSPVSGTALPLACQLEQAKEIRERPRHLSQKEAVAKSDPLPKISHND